MARVRIEDGVIDVVLSERNLLALLTKLHTPGSTGEITNNDVPEAFGHVRLRVEPDAEHYASESRQGMQGVAGQMHPTSERIMARVQQAVREEMGSEEGISQIPTALLL